MEFLCVIQVLELENFYFKLTQFIKLCKAQGAIICAVYWFVKTKSGTCKSLDLIFTIEAFNCFEYKKQDSQLIVYTGMKKEGKMYAH